MSLLDAFGGFFSKIEGRRDPAVVVDASLIDELFRDRTDYSRESEYSKMSPWKVDNWKIQKNEKNWVSCPESVCLCNTP